MSDGKRNILEIYLEAKFKEVDSSAHRVAGSGCGDRQKSDISNKYCVVEAKIKHTQENIIVKYKDEWIKTLNGMPKGTNKFPIIATENCYGERFITLSAEDFFNLLKEAKDENK